VGQIDTRALTPSSTTDLYPPTHPIYLLFYPDQKQCYHPRIDKLLEDGRATFDMSERKSTKFQRHCEESPAIFLSIPPCTLLAELNKNYERHTKN
jgi:hypothetical protein